MLKCPWIHEIAHYSKNVTFGDGSCFYACLAEQIARETILTENVDKLRELNLQAQHIYNINRTELKWFQGQFTGVDIYEREVYKRHHKSHNSNLPYLTTWSIRYLACEYALSKWGYYNSLTEVDKEYLNGYVREECSRIGRKRRYKAVGCRRKQQK